MRIHRHDPVWRVDPVVAAIAAYVSVSRENSTVQHQHVAAEHFHVPIHWRGIGNPGGAGTLPIHRIGNVHRGLHFHFHSMLGMVSVLMHWHRHAVCVVHRMFALHLMRDMFGFRFRFLHRHQRHSAFWTLAGLSADNLRMHRTGVELF